MARLDTGRADPAAFAAWRDGDPRHAVAYAQAVAAWERTGMAVGLTPARQEEYRSVSRRSLLRAAAIGIPVMLGGGVTWHSLTGRAHAATGPGEQRRLTVAEGITVTLNSESAIRWRNEPDRCDLWLDNGEVALFVDSAQQRSVVLHCGSRSIGLQPGEYNSRALNGAAPEILVLRGVARPLTQGQAIATGGQHLRFDAGQARIGPAAAIATANAAAWTHGEIVFDGQTLGEAVSEYNRYLPRKLRIDDPRISSLRIGGRFDLFRPEAFLASLESSFGLKARINGDMTLLQKDSAVQ